MTSAHLHAATASEALTLLFAAFLVLGLVLKFWLLSRQIRHVSSHRDAVPPPFAARITADAHRKAADYTVAKARLGLIELALGAALLLGWTLLGGLDSLNRAVASTTWPAFLGHHPLGPQLLLLAGFAAITGVLGLPQSLYQTFVLEQRYGFNRMTLAMWLSDALKGIALGLVFGLPLAALVLWLMGAAGPMWWLWAWATWTGFTLLLQWIFPSFIAPLFNRFEPLADESLKTRVTALMDRCGFAAQGLFVMDGSRRSAHGNAYFTGFGRAKRVVFFDTLLARLNPPEVEAVLAHELGHFRHRHVQKMMLVSFALSLAGFAFLGWLSTQTWFFTGLGVRPNMTTPNDALALLLFLLALPVFTDFIGPLFAQLSRRNEFQADDFAKQHASGQELASALLKLYEDNASTLTPDPLYVRAYYSHPPASERVPRLLA